MWSKIRDALSGVAEELGIDMPELPVDLSTITEAAGGAVAGVTEAAGGAVAGVSELPVDLSTITEAAGGAVAGVSEAAGGAVAGVSEAAGGAVAGVSERARWNRGGGRGRGWGLRGGGRGRGWGLRGGGRGRGWCPPRPRRRATPWQGSTRRAAGPLDSGSRPSAAGSHRPRAPGVTEATDTPLRRNPRQASGQNRCASAGSSPR